MFKNENFDTQNVPMCSLLQLLYIVQHLSTELGKVVFGLFRSSKLYIFVTTKYNGHKADTTPIQQQWRKPLGMQLQETQDPLRIERRQPMHEGMKKG